jgi:repressor LexA
MVRLPGGTKVTLAAAIVARQPVDFRLSFADNEGAASHVAASGPGAGVRLLRAGMEPAGFRLRAGLRRTAETSVKAVSAREPGRTWSTQLRPGGGGRPVAFPLTKRQREILDYLGEFIQQHGYAPSLEEIGRRFGLSSLATVHKHLTNLQEKGFIRRAWNRSRSVEMVPTRGAGRALELPLLGFVAAGAPIEAVATTETIAVPDDLVGKRDTYVLKVRGDSMIDEQIRDGDFVIVEDRKSADNGEMVIALLGGSEVTLKKFYRENGNVRLQPANPAMQPLIVAADQIQIQGVVVGVMRRY